MWAQKRNDDEFPKGFSVQRIGAVSATAVAKFQPADIASYFRSHPEAAKELLLESYDKRFTPSSFIAEEGDGFNVGWYSSRSGYECVRHFTDLADAATDYLLFSLGKGRWPDSFIGG